MEDDEDDIIKGKEPQWVYLKDVTYRQVPIYAHINWEIPSKDDNWYAEGLDYYPSPSLKGSTRTLVVGAPNGGPIARVSLPLIKSSQWKTTRILISDNAGTLLHSVDFPLSSDYTASSLWAMGYTRSQLLVVVLEDSLIYIFDTNGDLALDPFFAFGKPTPLHTAKVYSDGCVAVSTNFQTALVELFNSNDTNDNEGIPTTSLNAQQIMEGTIVNALVTPLNTHTFAKERQLKYLNMAVLPRHLVATGQPQVYLSTMDASVVVASVQSIKDLDCRDQQFSPFCHLAFCPNGRFLAGVTTKGLLTVVSSTLDTHVVDFVLPKEQQVVQLCWCGEDSVLATLPGGDLLMVGPFADWLRFPQAGYTIPEMDGCRLVSAETVSFLQRVPPPSVALLQMGSIHPGALLVEASQAFGRGQVVPAHEVTTAAMEACLDAATHEWDIPTQKRLLRAASFALQQQEQQSQSKHVADKLVKSAQMIRVLNAIRDPTVGLVMSWTQAQEVGLPGILARLVAMGHASLASRMAQTLRCGPSLQLYCRAAQASQEVKASTEEQSDSEVAQLARNLIAGRAADAPVEDEMDASLFRGAYAMVRY